MPMYKYQITTTSESAFAVSSSCSSVEEFFETFLVTVNGVACLSFKDIYDFIIPVTSIEYVMLWGEDDK